MIFGGFTRGCGGLRPAGATCLGPDGLLWQTGTPSARLFRTPDGVQVAVPGWCGAAEAELRSLARRPLPEDVSWRWSGVYAVVEQHEQHTVVHADPAGALPLYATRYEGGWVWLLSRDGPTCVNCDLRRARVIDSTTTAGRAVTRTSILSILARRAGVTCWFRKDFHDRQSNRTGK
ncbi:hypothetical protein [Streptomyces sp. NPDC051183]|uniref:hypothetical protein n=1 Tax=Streptomyces sp. NPDC051183 TaxID=3155165 RepID=UPI0034494CE3